VTIKDLLQLWENEASQPLTAEEYRLRLPLYEAAKVAALAELFPGRSPEQIIVDLLSAALDELQEQFPYVKGSRVMAYDEEGDPIHDDAGLTPRFNDLTRRHVTRLQPARKKSSTHGRGAGGSRGPRGKRKS
jgi:hypothetical protein